jgi:arginase
VTRTLSVIGNPSSAGSYAAGQDQAPAALRAAGLIEALATSQRHVVDAGDLPQQVWFPDPSHPYAQNLADVVENVALLRRRVASLVSDSDVLIIGGNCTVAIAACAGVRDVTGRAPALTYFDRHLDCNTPSSTSDGALDWMGLAHALDLEGAEDALCDALGTRPLLTAAEVAFLGVDIDLATEWERQQVTELGLYVRSSQDLADTPAAVMREAAHWLPDGESVVHLDVDVIDFTDAPLSESTDGRNNGPSLAQIEQALQTAVQLRQPRVFSVGELNPTRSAGTPGAVSRFIAVLTRVLSAH